MKSSTWIPAAVCHRLTPGAGTTDQSETANVTNIDNLPLLRLLQLVSPALPVGAFAYSQGQEYAVHCGWITNEEEAADWLNGLLGTNIANLDVPVFQRCYEACLCDDMKAVTNWNNFLFAARESAELQAEDHHMGQALARLLSELDVLDAMIWKGRPRTTFVAMFALAAARWRIPLQQAAQGLLWSWLENQVMAAIKLVPLGQTAGQRILERCARQIPGAVEQGLALHDDEIGQLAPLFAMASAGHETQYSRLFRS
jgi:urease accessory protein